MRGRITARGAEKRRIIYGAWQTERFAREEKLKPFGQYVKSAAKASENPAETATMSRGQAMLAGLLAHQQAGAPMTVRRVRTEVATATA